MTSSLGCVEGFQIVREALGISRQAVADRIQMKSTSYGRIERGERTMTLPDACAVAKMLGVPLDMLTRRPTMDEMLDLHHRSLQASAPAPAPDLLPRPVFTEGHGVSKTSRPFTDVELRDSGRDPALYVPGPAGAVVSAAQEATPARQPGADHKPTVEELLADWDDEDGG